MPYIPTCPDDVSARANRRTGTCQGRSSLPNGEELFVVTGKTDTYAVTIGTRPRCGCPDEVVPCKHLAYIYLDVLRVRRDDPRWWQTELSEEDVDDILGYLKKTKKRKATEPPGSEGSRIAGSPLPAINDRNTVGLHLRTVKAISTICLEQHPIKARQVLDQARATPFDGLNEWQIRACCATLAGLYPEVRTQIRLQKEQALPSTISFSKEIEQAEKAVCMLDRLTPRWQYERSGEVSSQLTRILNGILSRVPPEFAPESHKISAVFAFISIGFTVIEVTGEVGKCLRMQFHEITMAIRAITDYVHEPEEFMDDLRELAEKCSLFGIMDVEDLVNELEGESEEE